MNNFGRVRKNRKSQMPKESKAKARGIVTTKINTKFSNKYTYHETLKEKSSRSMLRKNWAQLTRNDEKEK